MKSLRLIALAAAAAALPALAIDNGPPVEVADGVYLAPAPWQDPDTPPSPPSFHAKAVSSVAAINTFNNAAVVAAYNTYWNVAMPAVGFTGNVAGCVPGGVALAFQEWSITRINFMRAMAGVPGNTTLDSSLNAQEQAAALIMSANNSLNHFPPATSTCYTPLGATAAGQSNLALGGLSDFMPLYMSEPGSGNQVAGHRRWILLSSKQSFGFGQTTPQSANALYAFQSGSAVPVPNGIPWPPRGFVPLELFPTVFTSVQRWSFGLPNANFGAANVSLARNGVPVAVTVVSRTDNGYGDNTIVWELPSGHTVTNGSYYTVTISGVTGAASSTYSYLIFPYDPSANSANVSVTQAATPNPVGTGKDLVYTFTVSNAGPTATPVTLTDAIPAGTTFIWASPGCTNAAGTVTCNVAALESGGSTQVKIVVRRAAAGSISNTGVVAGSPPDPTPANNSASTTVTVSASPAATAVFRYRLYSDVTKEHHFTTDFVEYTTLGALIGTWVQEGTVGKVLNNPGSFNAVVAVPYYRLYNTTTQWHHWTTDANEYYTLGTFPGWNLEGVDGYILPSATAGATQLYRLNYPALGALHHWTIDANEYNTLTTPAYGWVGEGGSGFVIQ